MGLQLLLLLLQIGDETVDFSITGAGAIDYPYRKKEIRLILYIKINLK